MPNPIKEKRAASSLGAAYLGAAAATMCCVGPLLLAGLGVGGVWAARVKSLESFRPAFIAMSLGFLMLAFYRAYRLSTTVSCSQDGSCKSVKSRRASHAVLWVLSVPLAMLLAFPSIAARLAKNPLAGAGTCGGSPSADLQACCNVPAAAPARSPAQPPTTQPSEPIDPASALVFDVENLQCPAVKGVGCGSMLWPVLIRIDRLDGVARSFTNWTGTRLRISVGSGFDRNAVSQRVRQFLASDERHPTDLSEDKLAEALRNDKWYSAAQLVDLSSYEFKTIARRRVAAFADGEKLAASQKERLLNLVDELWDKSAKGLPPPEAEPAAYGQYWRARLEQFVTEFAGRSRATLSAEQIERLQQQYVQRPPTRPTGP